jgi:hypothetical protein
MHLFYWLYFSWVLVRSIWLYTLFYFAWIGDCWGSCCYILRLCIVWPSSRTCSLLLLSAIKATEKKCINANSKHHNSNLWSSSTKNQVISSFPCFQNVAIKGSGVFQGLSFSAWHKPSPITPVHSFAKPCVQILISFGQFDVNRCLKWEASDKYRPISLSSSLLGVLTMHIMTDAFK